MSSATRDRGGGRASTRGAVDTPAFGRAAELLLEAAVSAPVEGRPMYAALRSIPVPDEVVALLFHAAQDW